MGSGSVLYISSFLKTGSGIQKSIGGDTDRQTATWSHKPTLFSQNKERPLRRILKEALVGIAQGIIPEFAWRNLRKPRITSD
jgi:hypothetical protein